MSGVALCHDMVRTLLGAGADAAEVFFDQALVRKVCLEHGELRERTASLTRGLGMRIEVDGRAGFASASDLSPGALRGLAQNLVRGCRLLPAAPGPTLPDTPIVWPASSAEDHALTSLPEAEHVTMAQELAAQALRSHGSITAVSRVLLQTTARRIALASSAGREGAHSWATASAGVSAVAESGAERSLFYGTASARRLAELLSAQLGDRTGRMAARFLGGRPIQSLCCPVLFAPAAMARLLRAVGPSLSGESAERGHSIFASRIGEQVASSAVTLVEDPTDFAVYGYAPFDHEGTPVARLALIEEGHLRSLAHNTATAARSRTCSTGSAWRGSYRVPPVATFANLMLHPGRRAPAELLALLGTGLHVLDVAIQGGPRSQTGALTMKAAGLWVEAAEPVRPVRGVTIACRMDELLSSVAVVGNDLEQFGAYQAPSVLFDRLALGGTA